MPLAKVAPQEVTQVETSQPIQTPSGIAGYDLEGVPVDVFRMFGVEMGSVPTKHIEQLRDITSWAKSKCSEPTIGNILQKISTIKSQLGSPALNEKSYSKVYQFVKMQKTIEELQKRQDALRGAQWVV